MEDDVRVRTLLCNRAGLTMRQLRNLQPLRGLCPRVPGSLPGGAPGDHQAGARSGAAWRTKPPW